MNYSFLSDLNATQAREIGELYEVSGWWEKASDAPEAIHKMVKGSHCFLGALSGEAVVGMVRAISDGTSDAYVQDLAVLPAYRGQGVAKSLIRRIVDRLHQDGIDWIGLVAERGTYKLYAELGFELMPDSKALVLKG